MDIQAMFNAIAESARLERAKYHLTLGELIESLDALAPKTIIAFPDGRYPGTEHSYRGYYSDLALEPTDTPITAEELHKQLSAALNKTYKGYKGGEFAMYGDTPLWCAFEGNKGFAIIDETLDRTGSCDDSEGTLILVTKVD